MLLNVRCLLIATIISLSLLAMADTDISYCASRYRNLCNGKGKHVACQFPSKEPGPLCVNSTQIPFVRGLREFITHYINRRRQRIAEGNERVRGGAHLPRPEIMMQVEWDRELAFLAQRLANQCNFVHDDCRATVRYPFPGQSVGEVKWRKSSKSDRQNAALAIRRVLDAWWGERRRATVRDVTKPFRLNNKGAVWGHFSQLAVWSMRGVGCGAVRHGSPYLKILLVCDFSHTNMLGQRTLAPGPLATCPLHTVRRQFSAYPLLCSSVHQDKSHKSKNQTLYVDQNYDSYSDTYDELIHLYDDYIFNTTIESQLDQGLRNIERVVEDEALYHEDHINVTEMAPVRGRELLRNDRTYEMNVNLEKEVQDRIMNLATTSSLEDEPIEETVSEHHDRAVAPKKDKLIIRTSSGDNNDRSNEVYEFNEADQIGQIARQRDKPIKDVQDFRLRIKDNRGNDRNLTQDGRRKAISAEHYDVNNIPWYEEKKKKIPPIAKSFYEPVKRSWRPITIKDRLGATALALNAPASTRHSPTKEVTQALPGRYLLNMDRADAIQLFKDTGYNPLWKLFYENISSPLADSS